MNYIPLVLIAVIFASFYPAISKFGMKQIPPTSFLAISQTTTALIFLTIATLKGGFIQYISFEKHSLAAYSNGFVMAISLLFFFRAIHLGPISAVVPIWSLNVVLAVIIGMLFLGEVLTADRVFGIFFAVLSIWFITR